MATPTITPAARTIAPMAMSTPTTTFQLPAKATESSRRGTPGGTCLDSRTSSNREGHADAARTAGADARRRHGHGAGVRSEHGHPGPDAGDDGHAVLGGRRPRRAGDQHHRR